MPPNPATSLLSLAKCAEQRARLRHRRETIGGWIAGAAAALLLLAIVAIPLFLAGEIWAASGNPSDGYSLWPLLIGTLKATVAALLVAVPLGLAAAIHVAAFASSTTRRRLRALMETLEALPSVVIGLIAAIWLAPLLKIHGFALLLAIVLLAVSAVVLSRFVAIQRRQRWAALPFYLLPLPLLALWTGDSALPAATAWGEPVNPWNTVLIGIAMGLANVPMLFNHAEASLRDLLNRHGVAAIALGAQPLQVMRSMVLPVALPSLVAAILVTTSRCSGETLIVLMASGNTPIASADPFDGLRSLAAELALNLPITDPASPAYARLLLATLLLFSISLALDLLARALRRRQPVQGATT